MHPLQPLPPGFAQPAGVAHAPCAPAAPGERTTRHGLLAAALALPCLAAPALAETAPQETTLAYKRLDYQDSQPDADRVRIKAHALSLTAPVGESWSFDATAVTDAVSGASPRYHTQRISPLEDRRDAATLGLTRYLPRGSVTVAGSYSTESDYVSRSLSATLAWFTDESKNTTLTAGVGVTRDQINPTNGVVSGERKAVNEVMAGITQVLTPSDLVQATVRHARGNGYYSDPYKAWDERPRDRNATSLLLRWNHHVAATDASARTSYRYYTDSFGLRAHTLGLEFEQPVGGGWAVTPLARLYSQNAASFYVPYDPNGAGQTFPDAQAKYYTQDQRLSAFGAVTTGIKLAWQVTPSWTVDAKFEKYRQRGHWALQGRGDPGLAPFNASSLQLGMAYPF